MTIKQLVKAIEEHVDLTYTDYDHDRNGDEYAVERINNLPDILKDLEEAKAKATETFNKYMAVTTELAKNGIKDGSVAVIKDTSIENLTANDLFIIGGTLNLTGTCTLTMVAVPHALNKELP